MSVATASHTVRQAVLTSIREMGIKEMGTPAELNVAALRNSNKVLLSVGGYGVPRSISVADLISLCVRRVRTNT